ncbi:MAG: quinolinate synthase [Nitrospiraceae bacterium]|nr:quinolinate synthase [Nitrospiraceae bacterium]
MSSTHNAVKEEILRLKSEQHAIILAHNYQRDEVQDIADFVGDSLELCRKAAEIDCKTIVFAGVHFMAESASILCPDKTVLLTEIEAGCPMADMIKVDTPRPVFRNFPGFTNPPSYVYPVNYSLRDIKAQHPSAPVVAYVNTSAAVKANSDICCTSANIINVIESLEAEEIICVPDKNLAQWAAKSTKKKIISWDGFCHVHERVTSDDVRKARAEHPNAVVLAHPECGPDVLEIVDHVTSTSGMLRFVKASTEKEFIIGTEIGILHRLRKENPAKIFYLLRKDMVCFNMKKTTLDSVFRALQQNNFIIKVPDHIRMPAKRALDRMLEVK